MQLSVNSWPSLSYPLCPGNVSTQKSPPCLRLSVLRLRPVCHLFLVNSWVTLVTEHRLFYEMLEIRSLHVVIQHIENVLIFRQGWKTLTFFSISWFMKMQQLKCENIEFIHWYQMWSACLHVCFWFLQHNHNIVVEWIRCALTQGTLKGVFPDQPEGRRTLILIKNDFTLSCLLLKWEYLIAHSLIKYGGKSRFILCVEKE